MAATFGWKWTIACIFAVASFCRVLTIPVHLRLCCDLKLMFITHLATIACVSARHTLTTQNTKCISKQVHLPLMIFLVSFRNYQITPNTCRSHYSLLSILTGCSRSSISPTTTVSSHAVTHPLALLLYKNWTGRWNHTSSISARYDTESTKLMRVWLGSMTLWLGLVSFWDLTPIVLYIEPNSSFQQLSSYRLSWGVPALVTVPCLHTNPGKHLITSQYGNVFM